MRRAVRRNLWHHSETMKRTIALAMLALAATWAFLFLPLAKPAPAGSKPASRAQDATPSPGQAAVPHRAEPVADQPRSASADPAQQPPARPRSDGPSARATGTGDVRIIGATDIPANAPKTATTEEPRSATQLAQALGEHVEYREPTGELGEGILSPDYRLLEESYMREARDGPWATQQELRIRNMLLAAGMGPRIVLVSCESSVCRVLLEPHGQDPYGELLRVPGLAAALGIDSTTPYSLNSAELIVYAKPEPIPEPPKN
jgi:hypothetical protein